VEVDARDLVVVLAPSDGDAEHEAAARQVVERRGLLGDERGVGPVGRDEDRGREPDPLRDRRGGSQRDQRLVVRVDDAIDRPQAGEAARLGTPGPVEHLLAGDPGDRGRQADSHYHLNLLRRTTRWPLPATPDGVRSAR
jgi:hypothetical protein